MAYSTIEEVRKGLPGLLYTIDYIGIIDSGTFLQTNINAVGCPYLYADGTDLVLSTGYTFKRPDTIALTTGADEEEYFAHLYTGAEDDVITDLITQADQIIDDKFYNYTQNGPSDTQRKTWSIWLADSLYLFSYCAGSEEDMIKGERLYNLAHDGMSAFIKNTAQNTPTKANRHKTLVMKV